MPDQCAEQLAFGFVPQTPIFVQRFKGQLTSDAGLLPIREFDQRWDYTRRMAQCLSDLRRDPQHDVLQMLRQRIYRILADYQDCNDHQQLRNEPIFKLIASTRGDEDPLAGQATLSRFENAVTPADLFGLLDFVLTSGVEHLKQANQGSLPASLTLDLDATDTEAHGQQQLTLFHAFYDQRQYYPLMITEPTTKHVLSAWLRHGTAGANLGADDDLLRVVRALRQERPDIAIHARADAAFAGPGMYRACEDDRLTYTFGLTPNSRLKAVAQGLLERAIEGYRQTHQKQRLFMAFEYQAGSWAHCRKVVAKAECSVEGTNLRFVVTNLPEVTDATAERIYDDYVQRGESEQRFDELKNGLHADRLSCERFMANFFRLLLHTAAFNLLNVLRNHPAIPVQLRTAKPQTWRSRLIKVAATLVRSRRRVVVAISGDWPFLDLYRAVAQRALSFSPSG